MATLKLNEELPFSNLHDFKVENVKGNIRLVAIGTTDSFSLSKTTNTARNFNGGITIIDSKYAHAANNVIYLDKHGWYMFSWHQRCKDSNTSQGLGIYLSDVLPWEYMFAWGANVYRNTLSGISFAVANAGDYVNCHLYSDTAITANPITVAVFAVTE